MFQQFIRTAMIKAIQDSSPPVDRYQRHLSEIIVAFGSELILLILKKEKNTSCTIFLLQLIFVVKTFIFSYKN
jgi:hypothetical protein